MTKLAYLGWLESHLELLAAGKRWQHHIVEGLVRPSSIRNLLEIHKGIAQGANACRENCSIGQRPKFGEDTSDRTQRGCGTDVP